MSGAEAGGWRLEAGRGDHEAAAANLGIYPPLVRVLSFLRVQAQQVKGVTRGVQN